MTNRQSIYYWKCDRPSAFFALEEREDILETAQIETLLHPVLAKYFGSENVRLRSGNGQGNHLTYVAEYNGIQRFIRIENGPEGDDFMEIEAHVLTEIKSLGVPAPVVYAVDATRHHVPFAYQVLEYLPYPDLNKIHKAGELNFLAVAQKIGENIAQWQAVELEGFGPFDPIVLRKTGKLKGLHPTYRDYFFLNWKKHLDFLVARKFLKASESNEIQRLVLQYEQFLSVPQGCLVHKDLALWNILGEPNEIKAFIDWDDTVSGDISDDLSLLACFHTGTVVAEAIKGYESIKPLPPDFLPRFWLHLLRNMVVKAVIRVGANYFDRKSDFFLIGSDSDGAALKTFTLQRIKMACVGLQNKIQIKDL
ncbi:aminoglycoside phosphotransferase family protein [Runella zeae]|uniref:aminoglycoside phosphotransferase family protein n=1 Tax=Runella zeae TaxID=94255 RepID=UPI00146EA134|nr:aminoglycoside phosphotransferase family protein [Runella zeae]